MTDRQTYTHTETVGSQPDKQAYRQTKDRPHLGGDRSTCCRRHGDREGRSLHHLLLFSLSHTHTHTDNDTWGRGLALSRHAHFCSPRSSWFSSLLLCHCNTHCLPSLHAAVYYIYKKKKSKDVISSNIRLSGLLDSASSQGKESLPEILEGEKAFSVRLKFKCLEESGTST